MVKHILSILILFAAWPVMVHATIHTNTTASSSELQTAINSASDGDTIIVPSLPATWSSTISEYPMPSIKIIAGGGTNGVTTLTQGSGGPAFFDFQPKSGGNVTIQGFTFVEGNPSTSISSITVNCKSNSLWRICSNVFNCQQGVFVYNSGEGAGLIDNNYFNDVGGNGDMWKIYGSSMQGGDGAPLFDGGHGGLVGNWAYGVNYGATNYIYVEHNTVFSAATLQTPDGPLEGYNGAKFVIRYNSLTNCGLGGWHGTDTGFAISTHSYEIYQNHFYYTIDVLNPHTWVWIWNSRGGTGLVYSNTATGTIDLPAGGFVMQNYRFGDGGSICSSQGCPPWNSMTGSNPYDGNTNADGWPGLAQQGVTGPIGGYVLTGSGTRSSQVLSPTYCWGNNFVSSAGTSGITLGRDYYTNGIGFSGTSFTNFPGSPGLTYTPLAYPFPLGAVSTSNAPSISGQPVTTTVTTNQTATFSVTASGDGTLAYQWNWTGTNVPNATSNSWTTPPTLIAWSNSPVLVVITNVYGSVTSSTAFLEVRNGGFNTYYVATTGNDGNNGSIGSPWATVEHATSLMSGGDTLFIRGGTYAEIFDIFGPSGSSGSPTLIQNYPSEVPVFNENDITSGAPTINGVSWMTLSGLTIKSNNIALVVGYAGACNNVILTNLTVTSIGQQGIQFENNSYNCQLLNSTIHDTGLWIYNGEGVYIGQGDSVGVTDNSHDILVKGCTIYNTGDEGIEMKGGTYNISAISNILYSDNLPQNPYGASGGAIEVDEEGVNNFWPINPNQIVTGNLVYNTFTGIRGGTGCKIINNVVYNCTNYGIYLNHFSGQSVNPTYTRYAYNNTVDEPTAKGVVVSGVTNSIINNIGSTNTYNLAVSGTYFSNYGGHDYHLLVGSAPIGAGANLSSVVPADFDGVSRPSTNLFDIGAYQYVSPPTSVGAPSPFLFLMQ